MFKTLVETVLFRSKTIAFQLNQKPEHFLIIFFPMPLESAKFWEKNTFSNVRGNYFEIMVQSNL